MLCALQVDTRFMLNHYENVHIGVVSRLIKYGNHCGLGHGTFGRTGGGATVDAIDRICYAHDRCNRGKRYDGWRSNCFCNLKMGRYSQRISRDRPQDVHHVFPETSMPWAFSSTRKVPQ